MTCSMCGGERPVTTCEVVDDSFARREHPERARAFLEEDAGLLCVELPVRDVHGRKYTAMLEVNHCPWCGRRLEGAE